MPYSAVQVVTLLPQRVLWLEGKIDDYVRARNHAQTEYERRTGYGISTLGQTGWSFLLGGIGATARALAQAAVRELAPPVVATARELNSAKARIQEMWPDTLTTLQAWGALGLSRAQATTLISTMQRTRAAMAQADTLLRAYHESIWKLNNPEAVPAFVAYLTPGSVVDTSSRGVMDEAYRALVGEAYADAHPIADPGERPEQTGMGFGSLITILGLGAGVIGGILVVKWLRDR